MRSRKETGGIIDQSQLKEKINIFDVETLSRKNQENHLKNGDLSL